MIYNVKQLFAANLPLAQRHSAASRKRPHKSNTRSKLSNFKLFVSGLLLGIFFTGGIIYLCANHEVTLRVPSISKMLRNLWPSHMSTTKEDPELANLTQGSERKLTVVEPRFDFYTELTKDAEPATRQSKQSQLYKDPDLKKPNTSIHSYLVRAGFYNDALQAEGLRADLVLNGFKARVEAEVQVGGTTCYVVLLGPYKNEAKATQVRQALGEFGVKGEIIIRDHA